MHPLEHRILETLQAGGWVCKGQRGLVSVSGGRDSMALLHLLHALREPLQLRLEVLHFDHGLRAESGADAEWVARRAGALELPVHLLRAEHLAQLQSGVQAAARVWRRTEAQRLAVQWDAAWVALGHQREDRVETLLLKLLRGVHLTRLRSMAWRQGLFVRPLLETSRAELTTYLRERGVDWLEDPSNRSMAYARNRVRHQLLPLLEQVAAGGVAGGGVAVTAEDVAASATDRIGERLLRLEAQSAEAAALLEAWLAEHPRPPQSESGHWPAWINAAALAALPGTLRGTVLHRFVTKRMPGQLDSAQVERALALLAGGAPAWQLHFSHGRLLARRGERLLLGSQPATGTTDGTLETNSVLHDMGAWHIAAPPGWSVREAQPGEPGALTLHGLEPGALTLRTRQPGDRFQPPWREHPLKVKDFLRDQGLPLWQRDHLPLLVRGDSVVAVWPRWVARRWSAPLGQEPPGRRAEPFTLVVETSTAGDAR